MVSTLKAKIDGLVDAPNYKWGLAGTAVLGAILLVAGQFAANKMALQAVGGVLLGLTGVGTIYKLLRGSPKKGWQEADKVARPESKAWAPRAQQPAKLVHRTHMNIHGGHYAVTTTTDEPFGDPTMTWVDTAGQLYGFSGGRSHPTAGTKNEEL